MGKKAEGEEKKKKKTKKRGNGEGSIAQRPDGRWMSQVTVGYDPKTGNPKRRTFYAKTRREVVEKMDEVREELKAGTYVEPTKITLGDWLDRWLETYMKPTLRTTTYESYLTQIEKHIKPTLGAYPLKKLLPSNLQNLYKDKLTGGRADGKKGGLSTRTVRYIAFILQAALKQAVKEGLLTRNVAEATNLPKHEKKEIAYLTTEEITEFIVIAQESRYYPALLLELGTGLRRGELLGLKWQDIDSKQGTATIRRSLVRTKDGPRFHEPKTEKSIRTVKLPDEVLTELKAHKARQNQEKLILSGETIDGVYVPNYKDDDLVFCQANGKLLEPRNFTRHFDMLLKKAKIRHVSFHSLRHTHATELLRLGIGLKAIQGRLGHADFTTTANIYAHLADSLQQEAADKINEVLKLGKNKIPSDYSRG